jgi:hypothetical protein
VLSPADAFVVTPATFNTVNKMASGAGDTLALGRARGHRDRDPSDLISRRVTTRT